MAKHPMHERPVDPSPAVGVDARLTALEAAVAELTARLPQWKQTAVVTALEPWRWADCGHGRQPTDAECQTCGWEKRKPTGGNDAA